MVKSISNLSNYVLDTEASYNNSRPTVQTSDALFESSLASAKELLQATNQAEYVGTQLTNDFITGKNEDIHSLLIAQEKSSVLLHFTMQIRNQVLDAYREIMRIPV